MSELSPRPGIVPKSSGLWRASLVAALFVIVAAAVAVLVLDRDDARPSPFSLPDEIVGPDPLAFRGRRVGAYERAAAFGLSHALFARSPGGVVATARRTQKFRPLVEDAVSGTGFDADLLEAIVFLESAGRADVIAGDDPEHASGLTQILAETATNFLGMPVNLAASRRLTRKIDRARRRGDAAAVARFQGSRRQIDARFDPAQALAGTARYLTEARNTFGREDLAVVSYHMGIGNLADVLRAYSGRRADPIERVVVDDDLSYARVYFDSSPRAHRGAWERLASLGDDSQTYYWRVLAAREIMRLYREDPATLERLAELHGRGPSPELVFHPPERTQRFAEPEELEAALGRGALRPIARSASQEHFRAEAQLDQLGRQFAGDRRAYRALTPPALRALRYVAGEVYRLSGDEHPLTVTRATYDEASGTVFTSHDPGAASFHTTGFAFDVRRRYGSGAQAEAFQWTLERLQALGLIAWTRGRTVIHVTLSPLADM